MSPKIWVPHSRAVSPRAGGIATIFICHLLLSSNIAHAQGCAQCLDSTQATPPSVQAGYRHAIYLLGGAGATFFIAGLILFRRNP